MITKLPDEDFKLINRYLKDYYGHTEDNANYRLVWADDERQIRLTKYTPEGLEMLYPEAREMPKYLDIKERYVLERLIVIPEFGENDIVNETLTYQAIWTFEKFDDRRNKIFVLPNFGACKFIVEIVLENMRTAGSSVRYRDPDSDPDEAIENKRARLQHLQEELFGDESTITDALSLRQGVGYGQGSSPNSSTPMYKSTN
jgi:hypothetical protein